jgi:GLPGLI family protein
MKYLLLLLFPFLSSAQTHRFIYEYQFKTDSLAKDFTKENMVLDINPDEVKFYPYFQIKNDSLNKITENRNIMWDDQLPSLKRKINSNRTTNYYFLDNYFSVESEDKINWSLSNETKKEGEYLLQKATTNFGGRKWIAWFTQEITINEGPYKFRGLPGIIFQVEDDNKSFTFHLIKSQKLNTTSNTIDFLETFAGQKPLPISQKILDKKILENFEDPLRDMRESFKNNTNKENTFWVMGSKVQSLDQFKQLSDETKNRMRRENNPIELDKAIHYPKQK